MTEFERNTTLGDHEIKSHQILVEKETGRVVAVFYNDYDLNEVLKMQATIKLQEAKINYADDISKIK